MFRTRSEQRRSRGPRSIGLVGATALVLLVLGPGAHGQTPVDQRVNLGVGGGGRLFDVNPQLGGRGYNYARPMSPLIRGNAIASGIAGGGLSLRSFSPIGAPTAFHASVGSAALSTFRRDSVSVANLPLGGGMIGQPFYDPATTVPTVGFMQGLSAPVTAGTGVIGPIDRRFDMWITMPGGLKSQIVGLAQPSSPPSLPLQELLTMPSGLATSSSIFGLEPPPRLPLPAELKLPWDAWEQKEIAELGRPRGTPGGEDAMLDLRLPGVEEVLATPLDTVLRSELYPRLGVVSPKDRWPTWDGRPGLILPKRDEEAPPERTAWTAPPVVDPSVLPGFDIYTDMRLALELEANPAAAWFGDMQEALRERPELASQVDQQVLEDARLYLEQMLEAPVRSFTGRGASALNDQMLKAESLMEIRHYTEAADRYHSAHLIDPNNPLPLLGKGHALLAAGLYESAAFALLHGIELADRFAGLAPVLLKRLDLQTLMGGGEVVDIRRAAIMKQLELREGPELRFLLGYLEYHSGDHQRGLENLRRAADNPRSGPIIGRYPAMLGADATLPARQPPGDQSVDPGAPVGPSRSAETAEDFVVPPRTK